MKKTLASLFTMLLCFAFISCGGDSGPSSEPSPSPMPTPSKVAVTGVSVSLSSIPLKEGETKEVTASVIPDNASNKNVSWKSDDNNVATVSGGIITAVAPGMTTITVTTVDGSKTATVTVTVTMDVPYRQKRALMALFEKTGGANWNNKWDTQTSYKDWYGVKVKNDYVTEIDLSDNNLTGQLPDGLQFLSKLTKLVLANNNLEGLIPPTLGDTVDPATTKSLADTRAGTQVPLLSELKTLDLSGNKFSGAIPEALGYLTNLTTLKLDHNKLTGNLPVSFANLSNLTTLTIAHNELEGVIPVEVVESKMWKNVGSKMDFKQDNGKEIVLPDKPDTPVAVTGVTLDKNILALEVGGTAKLTATVTPSNATDKTVSWSASDANVAIVSDGTVTAVAAGTTTITVTTKDGNKTATCTVTVTAPAPSTVAVTSVSLDKTTLALEVDGTTTLVATVKPTDATDKTVSWSSDNTSVATVDANGKVTAVAAGSATITITTTDGGKTATCAVTVTAPTPPATVNVTEVNLNKTTLPLVVGSSETLVPTVTPSNATDKTVSWSSDNTSVATVDANGKVTAVAAGSATITVTTTDGGKTATCTVTVTAPPTTMKVNSIALSRASMTIEVNDVVQLTATVKPDDATDKTVTWASDNTTVATVDATGKVTAKAVGTANITATANDGSGKKATCKVTVLSAGNSNHTAGDVSSEGQDW